MESTKLTLGLVQMRCGDRTLYCGRMGRLGNHLAVRVEREALPDE